MIRFKEIENEVLISGEEAEVYLCKTGLDVRLSIDSDHISVLSNCMMIDLDNFGEIELNFSEVGNVIKKPYDGYIEFDIVDKKGEDIIKVYTYKEF